MIADKYRLERLLGSGGMGIVFAAMHLELEQLVAVKLLRTESSSDDAAVSRFLFEARATARLHGPHVARVLDLGRLRAGSPFLVMELLEGQNLQESLAQNGALTSSDAVDIILEASEALAEAHRAGLVHRDLKPANLFASRDAYGDPSIKVLDFGISKSLLPRGDGDMGLTDSRAIVGSPVYMSPEQMQSARDVDHRTDIWALGSVLFELLTGRPVWNGTSLSELCAQIARDECPRVTDLCPGLSLDLAAIVSRCLQKKPALRYQHVADLALSLSPFASARGRAAVVRVLQLSGRTSNDAVRTTLASRPGSYIAPPDSGNVQPTVSASVAVTSKPRNLNTILLALALVLLGGVGTAWYRHRPAPTPATSTPATPRLPEGPPNDQPATLHPEPQTPTHSTSALAQEVAKTAASMASALPPVSRNSPKNGQRGRVTSEPPKPAPSPSLDPMSIRR